MCVCLYVCVFSFLYPLKFQIFSINIQQFVFFLFFHLTFRTYTSYCFLNSKSCKTSCRVWIPTLLHYFWHTVKYVWSDPTIWNARPQFVNAHDLKKERFCLVFIWNLGLFVVLFLVFGLILDKADVSHIIFSYFEYHP